jgi:hypothetical protein
MGSRSGRTGTGTGSRGRGGGSGNMDTHDVCVAFTIQILQIEWFDVLIAAGTAIFITTILGATIFIATILGAAIFLTTILLQPAPTPGAAPAPRAPAT